MTEAKTPLALLEDAVTDDYVNTKVGDTTATWTPASATEALAARGCTVSLDRAKLLLHHLADEEHVTAHPNGTFTYRGTGHDFVFTPGEGQRCTRCGLGHAYWDGEDCPERDLPESKVAFLEFVGARSAEPAQDERDIALHEMASTMVDYAWSGIQRQMLAALRTFAAVYADHPDYREEWRP